MSNKASLKLKDPDGNDVEAVCLDGTAFMLKRLASEGPAPDRAAQMMLYGQFVGSWEGTVVVHLPDGARRESTCEVHFGWALEGRAIQDVWIAPALRGRSMGEQVSGTPYATQRANPPDGLTRFGRVGMRSCVWCPRSIRAAHPL